MFDAVLIFDDARVHYKDKTTDEMLDLVLYFKSLQEEQKKRIGVVKIKYSVTPK